ncbi:endonuclease [Bifidobacterium catulorum]|uniref:Endonuclease n=2 Tax=Bifidobacterium catulorum TaxID=1630173 RepID=A0A2U2MUF5_9BIFI|nr:endonuclease [Bifidobacterium catulorum]
MMAKRMTIKDTDAYMVRRFRQRTKAARHDAWLKARAEGVGGSDMATILGLNRYATPYDLWLEKTGRRAHEDISDKWSVVRGNALEAELRRRFRRLHPEWQVTDGTDIGIISRSHPVLHASLDGFIWDSETESWGVLEIKTANAGRGRTDWHDTDGNLRAPGYYMAQVTHYMAATGFTWGVFYADIGEAEPVEVRFDRDEQDIETVIHAAEEFWGFVTRDEMPMLTGGDVAKAYPEPSQGVASADDDPQLRELFARYAKAQERLSDAKDETATLRDALIVAIGDRQGIRCAGFEATYKPYHRKAYVRKVAESNGRTFRFKTLKED